MSFDLYLERLASGESAAVDKAAVLAQLRRHCPDRGDKWGLYDVRFPDGSHVEFAAKGLESSDERFGKLIRGTRYAHEAGALRRIAKEPAKRRARPGVWVVEGT